MNFKDEYKKSAESISPDREAIDRMKAAVMAKIAEEQGEFPEISGSARSAEEHPEPTPHKKPFPFKRIAVIGGAVAACAVVTVSAMTLLPDLNASDMVAASSVAATNGSAMDAGGSAGETENDLIFEGSVAETAADEVPAVDSDAAESTQNSDPVYSTTYSAEAEEDASDSLPVGDLGGYDGADPGYAEPTEKVEPETYEDYDEATDSGYPTTGSDPADIPQDPAAVDSVSETVPYDPLDKANGIDDDIEEDVAEGTGEIPLATEEPDESDLNPSTGAPDDYIPEETLEIYFSSDEADFCEETIEVEDEYEPRLLLGDKGWLTYDGVRYDLDSGVKTAMFPLSPVTITNTLDGKDYYLYIDGRVIKVFDGQKNFIGLYRKRV